MPFYWGQYGSYYYLVNDTAPASQNNTDFNETDPVMCVCENYLPCGCDNANGTFMLPDDLEYAVINGTEYAIINGTLENGTAATSAGMGKGLHLTRTGTWGTWIVFGAGMFLVIQLL